MSTLRIKIVLVGDCVGKTCVARTFVEGKYPGYCQPTVLENLAVSVRVDGYVIKLVLWDIAGWEDYDRLRPQAYPQTDVFLLCFSLNNPDSFSNIKHKWYPEVKHHCPSASIILVGTTLDQRNEIIKREGANTKKIITTNQGLALMKEIGARAYVECSALTGEHVKRVFDEAIMAVIEPDPARV